LEVRSAQLRERIDRHCGDDKRATVYWSCGGSVQCTTGKIIDLFDDILVLIARTPTVEESLRGKCEDLVLEETVVLISLESVCAVALGIRDCRQGALPICCPGREKFDRAEGCGCGR
jgi:hypothetical protein